MDCMCEGGHVSGTACKYWHGSSEGPACRTTGGRFNVCYDTEF